MEKKRDVRAERRRRRRLRSKKRIFGTSERPRLVVYKSLKATYAQLVDDAERKTIGGISSLNPELKAAAAKLSKAEAARLVGEGIAKIALQKGIKRAVFDRNGYPFHGRVKAVAEGVRKAGLEF